MDLVITSAKALLKLTLLTVDTSEDDFQPLEGELSFSYFHRDPDASKPLTEADIGLLGRYLRRLLVVDPAKRATARDLLDEPWVEERIRDCTST